VFKDAWKEFKGFAVGGNMLDLALGFIIGAAFAGVVESLANDIIMGLVSNLVGDQSFKNDWIWGNVAYGKFVASIVNFLILSFVLFLLVKLIKRAGLGNFKAQGQRECNACKEFVAVDASRCKFCTSELVPEVPDED
jgi:large conductance mechanosensitive channel